MQTFLNLHTQKNISEGRLIWTAVKGESKPLEVLLFYH